MSNPSQPSPRALWALYAAAFLISLDVTLLNIALPTLSRDLHQSLSVSSRAVLAYIIAVSCLGPVAGRLADQWSIRGLLSLGYWLFGGFSLLCAFSPNIDVLTAMRAGQGAGGALLYVLGPAAVARWTPEERRGRVLGVMGAAAMLGVCLGPTLGGLITERLGWQWVFGVNAPLALAGLALTARYCPREPAPAFRGRRLDWPGALAGALFLAPLVAALNAGQEMGWLSAPTLAAFAASGLFLVLFVWRELRAAEPVIDLSLVRGRATALALAATMAWLMVFGGLNLLIPVQAQSVLGLGPEPAGYLVLSYAAAVAVFTLLGGRLADARPAWWGCAAGLAAMLPGLAGLASLGPATPLIHAAVWMALVGVGHGFFTSASMTLVLRHTTTGHEGAASGLFCAVKSTAQLLGVAVFEAVLSHASSAPGGELMTHAADARGLTAAFHHVFALAAALCATAMTCVALAGARNNERRPPAEADGRG